MTTTVQVHWQKRIDNSRLLRQRDPGYVREWAGLVAGALICLAVVLVCAWQYFEYVQVGYRMESLRARQEQVREWNRTLRLEHATLTDPMRIDALARSSLGLVLPQAGQVIPLGTGEPPASAPLWARAATPAGRAGAASVAD